MQHNPMIHARNRFGRTYRLFGAFGLACMLLFAGWYLAQAHQVSQLHEGIATPLLPRAAVAFDAVSQPSLASPEVTSTLYLPFVAQTVVQTTTLISPQAAWTAAWWQWNERVHSLPIYQEGNVDCGLGQSGDIWFLAGSEGTVPITRTCTVLPNKTLVVPLQTAAWNNEATENLSVPEKRAVLDSIYSDTQPGPLNSKICHLEANIDGKVVDNTRLQAPTFAYRGDPEAVADGFWFAFKVPIGVHVIHFQGTLCDFDSDAPIYDIDVTYTLNVEFPGSSSSADWQLFVWNTEINSLATGCSPADPDGVIPCGAVDLGRNSSYAGTPPWDYDAPAEGAMLKVVDIANGGDEFEIFDNDVSIGHTSSSQGDAYCPVPEGGDPGICFGQEGISSGEFALASGAHSITIKPENGSDVGVAYFRLETIPQTE
ncbi:MAG: hypothetical protein KDE19_12990 [Caldilineaceae bacterium]|nr:hypothetical protein [Caldilineaceae bacterium]